MKNKHFYRLFIAVTIIGSFLVFNSCQQDDIVDDDDSIELKSKFSTIRFDELPSDIRNSAYFDNLNRQFNEEHRSLLKSSNPTGMTIDMSEIGQFHNGDNYTFTFKVQSDSLEISSYNLMVSVDSTNQIIASNLLKYTPSNDWLQDRQPLSGTVTVNPSTSFDTEINGFLSTFNKNSGLCITGASIGWVCDAGNPHSKKDHEDEICTAGGNELYITYHYGSCPNGADTQIFNREYDFEEIPRSGGGSGNTPNNPVPCNPLFDPDCGGASIPNLQLLDKGCESLNDFMNDSDIEPGSTNRDYIYQDLRMHSIDNDFEKGQLIRENIINNQPQRNYTELTGSSRSNGLNIPRPLPDGNIIGLIHTHWEDDGMGSTLSPMFSLEDFIYFCKMAARREQSGKDTGVLTFILVSHTGDVYALKPSNIDKLKQFLIDFYADNPTEEQQIRAKEKFNKSVLRQNSQRLKEKRFLELTQEAEAKMYQYNTNTDNWEQIVDDPSNNDRKPC